MPILSMMGGIATETAGSDTSTSAGTILTASASANTKGSYAQLIASTARDTQWAMVSLGNISASRRYLVDIAIGAAASEVVIIPNLLLENHNTGDGQEVYLLPVSIPSGARVAARCQASTGSSTVCISVVLIAVPPGSHEVGLHSVVDYGTVTGTSSGTSVDPGGSGNTKGAWVQLSSSTTKPIRWLIVSVGDNLTNLVVTQNWLIDIGIGAAASEIVIVPDLFTSTGITSDRAQPAVMCFPCAIPQGVRLAVRSACVNTTATERLLDIACYGCG